MTNKPVAQEYKAWPLASRPLVHLHIVYADWKGLKLFIYTDSYSKLNCALFVKFTDAENSCRCLTYIFSKYGISNIIVLDNGSLFNEEKFVNFYNLRRP